MSTRRRAAARPLTRTAYGAGRAAHFALVRCRSLRVAATCEADQLGAAYCGKATPLLNGRKEFHLSEAAGRSADIGARTTLILAVFLAPLLMGNWPLVGEWVASPYEHAWGWAAGRMFGPAVSGVSSWAAHGLIVATATAAALIWTLVRPHRVDVRILERARGFLRVAVGVEMLWYAAMKLVPAQFGPWVPYSRLLTAVGDLSPLQLLWTLMGHSRPYQLFTACVELIGGLLLLSRRTATVGALITLTALTNVFALDLAYHVMPVQSYTAVLILCTLLVLAPRIGPLVRFLLLHEAVPPEQFASRSDSHRGWRLAGWLCVTAVVVNSNFDHLGVERGRASIPMHGVYSLVRLDRSGTVGARLFSNASSWRGIVLERSGAAFADSGRGPLRRLLAAVDTTAHNIELAIPDDTAQSEGSRILGFADYSQADVREQLEQIAKTDFARRLRFRYDASRGDTLQLDGLDEARGIRLILVRRRGQFRLLE